MKVIKRCLVGFLLEFERRRLHRLIESNHMCDRIVVKKSRELDELVLLHMKLSSSSKSI